MKMLVMFVFKRSVTDPQHVFFFLFFFLPFSSVSLLRQKGYTVEHMTKTLAREPS
jgi:hypothetical protein